MDATPKNDKQEPTPIYADVEKEQALRANLEETWQDESPLTASSTEYADEVDGSEGTRHREKGSEDKGSEEKDSEEDK
ncbi:MAG: hypothetical protein ACTHW1_08870 [Ancrocorticia sp.]|uniref:hypothetical protein n=1 Tax=Ancrocorticia sp. TaxID=2593684 RepID=UPI003F90BF31